MDIGSIGAQFNSPANPFSSGPGLQRTGESGDFEGLLRRMQGGNTVPGARVDNRVPIDKSSELYEVCLELETILMKNLIKGMRSTIMKSGLVDSSFAGEVYEDMLYDEYAKTFTRNANLGFAEMAYRQLSGTW